MTDATEDANHKVNMDTLNKAQAESDLGEFANAVLDAPKEQEKQDKLVLTKSQITSYWKCEQRYQFAVRDLLEPTETEDYFLLGDLFHLGTALGTLEKNTGNVRVTLLARISERERITELDPKQLEILTEASSLTMDYFNKYGFESDIHRVEEAQPEVLVGTIDGLDVHYTGRIDAMKGTDILERKTARAMPSAKQLRRYHKDPQGIGYKLLCPEATGVIYDFAIKTKTHQFHREEVLIPDVYLEHYKHFLLRSAARMLPVLEGLAPPDRNMLECMPAIGRICPYLPICFITNPVLRQEAEKAYYNKLDKPADRVGYDAYLGRKT